MTTVLSTCSSSSLTSACSGWLCSGNRNLSDAASTDVCPAAHSATRPASIVPRFVVTPVTRSPSRTNPVTSQFWMRWTPRRCAARAYAHAT
jgi:hypothetical protein